MSSSMQISWNLSAHCAGSNGNWVGMMYGGCDGGQILYLTFIGLRKF
jgi:hypothetical protein